MKQLKLLTAISIVAGMFLLNACNSGENKTDTSTDTTTAKKDTSSTTTNTVTPTDYNPSILRITHKVANFTKWKMAYESHDSSRVANGLHNYVIGRGTEDSNMVLVALVMDDTAKAKQWTASPDLKSKMKDAGVMGPVTINFIKTIMNDTTAIQQTVRLEVHHKVKDWDAWKKVFDSDKQARMDAGLTDRVAGHSSDDNHDVFLVFAVADVAKAKAMMGSKALKDKMTQGGVEGAPSFFFYRIVKKY